MKNNLILFFKNFKNFDKQTIKIMNYGFIISMLFGIFGIFSLIIYKFSYISINLVDIGILLFKNGLLFTVQILACVLVFNFLKNSQFSK